MWPLNIYRMDCPDLCSISKFIVISIGLKRVNQIGMYMYIPLEGITKNHLSLWHLWH